MMWQFLALISSVPSIFLLTLPPVVHCSFLGVEVPGAGAAVTEIRQDILDELESALTSDDRRAIEARLGRLEPLLRPIFAAAPKNAHGALGGPAARYALDRLFLQLHGLHVKGLRPAGETLAGTSPATALIDLVPAHVHDLFQIRLKALGLDLRELTVLAALLENLVNREAEVRLRVVYRAMGYSRTGSVLTTGQASTAVDAYMVSFILGFNVSELDPQALKEHSSTMQAVYPTWRETQEFLRGVQQNFADTRLDFGGMLTIVEAVRERYNTWQSAECLSIKNRLVGLEDSSGSGRVALRDFYQSSLGDGQWFTESVQYLRQSGALDESDPAAMRVLIPNYVGSPTNCVASSTFYAVCCPNECERIVSLFEGKIGGPTATPMDIVSIVTDYLSAGGNQTLSFSLVRRLEDVAEHHSGRIPLHGRLFAQWLHHVFPRECPYPHISGTTRPQQIADWESEIGESGMVSEEEIQQYVSSGRSTQSVEMCSASWSMEEELLDPDAHHAVATSAASEPFGEDRLDRLLLVAAVGSLTLAAAGILAPLLASRRSQPPDTVYCL